MKPISIAFFNNKGGVGKTSLVYHLAWMFADQGKRVVAADLDPQANLTAAFVDEDRLEELWPEGDHEKTIFGSIEPLLQGVGDISAPHVERIDDRIGLIAGDLALSAFEDDLSATWSDCLDEKERAFRVVSAFWRIAQLAATQEQAEIILLDVGPNLGAINRAALVAADYVVIPLSPDLFSLQGLRNLGPTLRKWRQQWGERLGKNPNSSLQLPAGSMNPIGYVVLQHGVRLDRPVIAYDRWIKRIPLVYRDAVLNDPKKTPDISLAMDPNCLMMLKHYHSLMPMAQEARKPIFYLRPADGAIGAHFQAVNRAYGDFESLAEKIEQRTLALVA